MNSRFLLPLLAALVGANFLHAGETQQFWRFSAGAAYRQLGDLNWTTGSRSADFVLPGFGPDVNEMGAAGPASGPANRTYVDGYVRPEKNTPGSGNTWYWGFESNSQMQGGSLVFHGDGGRVSSSESSISSADWSAPNLDGYGPVLQAEWVNKVNSSWSWSVLGSAFYTQFDAGHSGSTFSASQSSSSMAVTDSYNLGGLLPPAGPYHGDFAGPGPTLPASPSSRSTRLFNETNDTFVNHLTQSFELNLVTLSLGPSIEWHRGGWGLQAGGGLAVNIANWSAQQRETLFKNGVSIAQWTDRESDTEALLGGFVQAAVHRSLGRDWHISAFVRYDWSQGIETQVGPSRFELDLDSFTAGLMIGRTF